jgi:hypothetical protein
MSISAPFIARPIATSLLAVAVLLCGVLGYVSLPVSALPQVDFPTIEVTTQLPGANPDTVATLITASLERQFGQIQGLTTMTSTSSEGTSRNHPAILTRPQHRQRQPGCAGRHQRRRRHAAAEPAVSAGLFQGEPGRRADPDPRADL